MSDTKNLIGVVYSPGCGAGWSTWGDADQALDQELAHAIEDGKDIKEILEIAERNWPTAYNDGLTQAEVQWVDKGTEFRITEYEGYETIVFNDEHWMVAK